MAFKEAATPYQPEDVATLQSPQFGFYPRSPFPMKPLFDRLSLNSLRHLHIAGMKPCSDLTLRCSIQWSELLQDVQGIPGSFGCLDLPCDGLVLEARINQCIAITPQKLFTTSFGLLLTPEPLSPRSRLVVGHH